MGFTLVATAVVLVACGGGGDGGTSVFANGTLKVSLTDAPACGYDAVHVTIDRVRVHRTSTAADNDSGWAEVVLSPAKRVNLLDLTNGVLEELGQTALPAGTYTQLRLVLADNSAATPLANAVTPSLGSPTALTTPSAQQSGLKLNVNITVEPDKVADVVLDFDACRSVVRRGNSGQYNLKPVLSVIPRLSDAGLRVVGYVDPVALPASATSVSVQASGVPAKATVPDATGRFVLYPVPVGSYDLVVTSAGRATAVVTGVPVTSTAITTVNTTDAAARLAPPSSGASAVAGSVLPDTASVRATQRYSATGAVEVAWLPVSAAASASQPGTFGANLPVGAPVVTSFAAAASAVTLTPYPAGAGRYRIEATSGSTLKFQDIDFAAAVGAVNFVFP